MNNEFKNVILFGQSSASINHIKNGDRERY